MSDFYSILLLYLTDVQWLEKKSPTNVILISIHVNAAGDGTKWMNATGWSCYTCKGQTESDRLADCLYKTAEQILKNQVIRTDYARDGDADWEENFFMDSHYDLKFLQSRAGKHVIINIHVEGIAEYLSWLQSI